MKKILALCSIPAAVLAFTVACDDGSNVVPCTTDDDCTGLEDTPVCDTELEQCVAGDDSVCEENKDCQIGFNNSGGTLAANPSCANTAACEDGESCAKGFDGAGFCVLTGACPDGTTGAATVTVDLLDGGTGEACVDAASTCDSGTCKP